MSSINRAYEAFQEGAYTKALLRFNHSSDITIRLMVGNIKLFGLEDSDNYFSKDAKNKGKAFVALILIPAIPGGVSSAFALIKDTLLTITYLVSSILLGLAALLTVFQIPGVNNTAKKSAILLLDSVCNIGIDTIGIFSPYSSLVLSRHSYRAFKDLL